MVATRLSIFSSRFAIVAAVAMLATAFAGPLSFAADKKDEAHAKGEHAKGEHAVAAIHEPDPLEHVQDSKSFHMFMTRSPHEIKLPNIFGFQITKFMVLEVIAALLICAIFIPLAQRAASGDPPTGIFWNTFESLLSFIRNEIAKPNLGEHHADEYVPMLWTLFLFILFNNLLGMLPFMGSATADINVTVALALIVFIFLHGAAIKEHGFAHYIGSYWPHFDVPFPLGYFIKPLVFVIEIVGVLVKNMVLAVRLFANMFAGHMVLATILIFIYMAKELHPGMWSMITGASVFGILALSLLEIFVAFLQAFIFTFLTSLFMGMALHPQH